ncbi:hypothetical protein JW979_04295 [bacterium]|nr:hypothetical protein [candidate division CSSED10-310 bacterium]
MKLPPKINYLLFFVLAIVIQKLFISDYYLFGVFLWLISFVILIAIRDVTWTIHSPEQWKHAEWFFISVLWIATLFIRLYHIEKYFNIGDLSARYGYAINEILKGNHIFPFLSKYEYDETLTAYLFVPFVKLFGMSWTTLKVISIGYASCMIVVVYALTRRISNSTSAICASGLIALSPYFQRCDPIPGLLRFDIVTIVLLASLTILMDQRNLATPWKRSVILALLSAVAVYIHSSGRIVPVIILGYGVLTFFNKSMASQRSRIAKEMVIFTAVLTILCTPLIIAIFRSGGYLFNKRRQIFGFHEKYPFEWMELLRIIRITLTNFNYRAELQSFFPGDKPLLPFVTATGFLGGIWLLLKNIKTLSVKGIVLALSTSILALCVITPGNWRGLYFTPAVGLAILLAGLWFGHFINLFLTRRYHINIIVAFMFLMAVGWIRIPSFHSGPRKLPVINEQVTVLFSDLQHQPNVPHFFSRNLHQCAPNLAVYEFTKGTYADEYYVFLFDPLRYMSDYNSENAFPPENLSDKPFVMVFSPQDNDRINEIQKLFKNSRIKKLQKSGLLTLEINFPGSEPELNPDRKKAAAVRKDNSNH